MKGALVTGAGMRVGRALAMALADDGFFMFVHYNRSAGPHPRSRDQRALHGWGRATGVARPQP